MNDKKDEMNSNHFHSLLWIFPLFCCETPVSFMHDETSGMYLSLEWRKTRYQCNLSISTAVCHLHCAAELNDCRNLLAVIEKKKNTVSLYSHAHAMKRTSYLRHVSVRYFQGLENIHFATAFCELRGTGDKMVTLEIFIILLMWPRAWQWPEKLWGYTYPLTHGNVSLSDNVHDDEGVPGTAIAALVTRNSTSRPREACGMPGESQSGIEMRFLGKDTALCRRRIAVSNIGISMN